MPKDLLIRCEGTYPEFTCDSRPGKPGKCKACGGTGLILSARGEKVKDLLIHLGVLKG